MRIKINGNHDLDSIHLALQQVIAHLQDENVAGIERMNLYLTARRHDGEEKTLAPIKTDAFEIVPDKPAGKAGGQGRGYRKK